MEWLWYVINVWTDGWKGWDGWIGEDAMGDEVGNVGNAVAERDKFCTAREGRVGHNLAVK
jgi:hypothetical protein